MEHNENCEVERILSTLSRRMGLTDEDRDRVRKAAKDSDGLCFCTVRRYHWNQGIPWVATTRQNELLVEQVWSFIVGGGGLGQYYAPVTEWAKSQQVEEREREGNVIGVDFRNRRKL